MSNSVSYVIIKSAASETEVVMKLRGEPVHRSYFETRRTAIAHVQALMAFYEWIRFEPEGVQL